LARWQRQDAIAAYRFNDAAEALYHFTWGTFCDWYLEFTKPILADEDTAAVDETQAVIGWTLGQLLRLLHPFMPFITEELWEHLGGTERGRLITAAWPEYGDDLIDPRAGEEMDWVIQLISEIRGVRGDLHVPPGARMPLLVKDAGETIATRLNTYGDIILRMARLASIELTDASASNGAVPIFMDDTTAALPLGQVIDLAQERSRLERELEKAEGEIAKFDKKLANQQFLTKAPAEVVGEQRERRAETAQLRDKLAAALDRLAG
jgi:valyl-tRNA synthetase